MGSSPGTFRPSDITSITCLNKLIKWLPTKNTYLMIKPDGVQRGLVGDIIKRFEAKGFKLVAMKFVQPTEELLKQHYADLSERKFFPGLVKYMASGPVVCMVWEGLNMVKTGRVMLG